MTIHLLATLERGGVWGNRLQLFGVGSVPTNQRAKIAA